MAWKDGPLPPNTWNWGGVVTKDSGDGGFYFADFHGDHVVLTPGHAVVKAEDVLQYDNGLTLPGKSGPRLTPKP